jgi:2-haloacid dehalogenase
VDERARGPFTAVVFDLGGVLIDWDPRYLYRRLFRDDEPAMEAFLRDVVSPTWNAGLDAGRDWSQAIAELVEGHPALRDLIEAYETRWPEMLGGPIDETVEVLAELRSEGVPLYAVTNWSARTYPIARRRFGFLDWFQDVVVSGEVGIVKPDRRIFEHLLARNGLVAASTVLVDDNEPNVRAAAELGFVARRFVGAIQLRRDLSELGLLPPR